MKSLFPLAIFSSISLLTLTSALGCAESSDSSPSGGDGGPSTTDGGAEASACSTEGTGSIAIVVTGLPAGLAAKAKVTGPSGTSTDASGSTTLADQPAGNYSASAERVAKPDAIVRTLYEPKVSTSSFCLEGKQTQTLTIAYSEVASSNKLWSTNANKASGQLLAFAGADLAATGAASAKVAMKGVVGAGGGKAVAFDKDGNLWTLGATTTDAALLRFPAAGLGASGEKTPDRKIDPKLSGCSPAVSSIAFDPSGALWATVQCSDQILRLSPDTLSASKEYTPAASDFATGSNAPRNLAFDKSGNMWVSDETSLRRYSAASLGAAQAHVPDFELKAKAQNDAPLPPDALAFDKDGNLWVTSFGGNVIYKLTSADLAASGPTKEIVPSVSIAISVGALLESLAFDESGGLWLTFTQGKIARLAPTQLGMSSDPGAPTIPETIITSADIGSAGGMAFFPAPAALPIYSRFE